MKKNKEKTIVILSPKIDTFSNPTLVVLIQKLINRGYKIIYYGFDQLFVPSEYRKYFEFLELPFNFYTLENNLKSFVKLVKQYVKLFVKLKLKNKVNTIICVDPMGLVIGGRIKSFLSFKLVYASFEIFFEDEFFVQRKKVMKKLEMNYSKLVDIVIIQDEKRETLLKSVNNFSDNTEFHRIPVSPLKMEVKETDYDIHKELNIPDDKLIVIYSGSLQNWSGLNEIISLFPEKWNNEFWLIIHTHQKLNEDSDLKIEINQLNINKQNITIHEKPFYRFEEYFEFLSKCNIGIATYFPNNLDIFAGKNLEAIGLSSGKFSAYMMLGIPTITTNHFIYRFLNNKYKFGQIINTISELPDALNKIRTGLKEKSESCQRLYDEVLNPEMKIESLIDRIESKN
ncbi:MAG TPA: hypothetical protein PK294_00955 [Ignavibacteria bacterium]|nr:hypothetical protein [Ignavibacteria bacterium]HQY51128.1 hypothetical protein [Ignavibacteria bacterium]HRA98980.1 hypothetical protein [Ignavibacteria bacterium]